MYWEVLLCCEILESHNYIDSDSNKINLPINPFHNSSSTYLLCFFLFLLNISGIQNSFIYAIIFWLIIQNWVGWAHHRELGSSTSICIIFRIFRLHIILDSYMWSFWLITLLSISDSRVANWRFRNSFKIILISNIRGHLYLVWSSYIEYKVCPATIDFTNIRFPYSLFLSNLLFPRYLPYISSTCINPPLTD